MSGRMSRFEFSNKSNIGNIIVGSKKMQSSLYSLNCNYDQYYFIDEMRVFLFYVMRWAIDQYVSLFLPLFLSLFHSFFLRLWIALFISNKFFHQKFKKYIMILEQLKRKNECHGPFIHIKTFHPTHLDNFPLVENT